MCGGPDARHRVTDAAWQALRAGESMPDVAEDYGLPLEMVRRLFVLSRPPSPRATVPAAPPSALRCRAPRANR